MESAWKQAGARRQFVIFLFVSFNVSCVFVFEFDVCHICVCVLSKFHVYLYLNLIESRCPSTRVCLQYLCLYLYFSCVFVFRFA